MPKSIVLGNGSMLVGLDRFAQVKDFFYPQVGLENQVGGLFYHKIGVWVDDQLSWFEDRSWEFHINYQEQTLVSEISAVNNNLQIKIEFNDVVYNEKSIFIRKATVHNLADRHRQIKLFFHQEFEIYESHRGDTAFYDPIHKTIIHYKGRRVFLINAICNNQSFDDYSVGLFNIEGKEGTWKDAEDGRLEKNSIEHGMVDSVIGVTAEYEPHDTQTIFYWIVAAKLIKEANETNNYILEKTPTYLMKTTADFWHAWVNRQNFTFQSLDESVVRLFKKSLLILRTQVDNDGAVIASGDSDLLHHGRDTYAYMWPRDGALTALALDKSGDQNVAKKFFEFCNEVITDEGYFMHKYRSDKSLGSSWHGWVKHGKIELPIQEDETALVIFALMQHYQVSKDLEFIEEIYNSLIKKAAEFMISYRDEITGLPKPSYDLWEEKFGISTFTASTVVAALNAAGEFAKLLGKTDSEAKYKGTAQQIKEAMMKYLYDEGNGYFYKMVYVKDDGQIEIDPTIDMSSIYGVWKFGILDIDDEKLQKAMQVTKEALTVPTEVGGIVRYQDDYYFRVDQNLQGNPWFITTLWYAQFLIDIAKNDDDFKEVRKTLEWVVKYAMSSGVLSEQLNPHNGDQVSATPLTWSHAEFVVTVIQYLEKLDKLGICIDCDPVE